MDDDGPDDRDDDKDDSRKPAKANLILLPGGKRIDPADIGTGYVERQQSSSSVVDPEVIDPVAIDVEMRERDQFVSEQKLVDAIRRRAPTVEIVEAALLEMAEEISHVKYERRKAAKDGKQTAGHSMSRVAGLRSIADLLLKRLEASRAERLDLQSPRLQAIFKVWMEFFYESMEKVGVESSVIDLVFQQMKADMVGWEKRMDGISE